MNPARQLAQFTRRLVELFKRRVEQRGRLLRIARDQVSRQAEIDAERHQPLLCSVVEVPLQPLAFRVSRGDDPRARGAELVNVRTQLGVQPLILECERCGGADRPHEVALLCKLGIVDDGADPPTLVLDDCRDLSLRRRIQLHRSARGIDVGIPIWHPIGELDLWVSKRLREGIPQRSSTDSAAKPGDERADRLDLAEAESQQAGQKCKRKTGQRAEQRQRQPVVDAARQAGLFDDQRRHQKHEGEAADGEDGGKAPPLTVAAVAPASVEARHDRAQDCDRDVQLRRADDSGGRVRVIDQQRIGGALGAPLLRITEYERGQLNDRRVEVRDCDEHTVEPAVQSS